MTAMNIILSCPSQTIYQIRDLCQIPTYIKRKLPTINKLIRWGSLREAQAEITYNTPAAIRLVSNKPKCRQVLQSAGIFVPEWGEDKFPCIGRPRYHTGGQGFWICRSAWEVSQAKTEGAVYFSHLYPKQNEYRVHIGTGKVILYSEKIGNKFGGVIWNHDIGGFEFKHIGQGDRRLDVINLAKSAVKLVGLDFGAVDVLTDPTDSSLPKAVVCEINTAPAGSPYMVKCYARYFKSLLEMEEEDE